MKVKVKVKMKVKMKSHMGSLLAYYWLFDISEN